MKKNLLLLAFIVLTAIGSAKAQVVFYEDFNSYTTDAVLIGQGSWYEGGTSTSSSTYDKIIYPTGITTPTNFVKASTTGDDKGYYFGRGGKGDPKRDFSAEVTTGTLYYSVLLKVDGYYAAYDTTGKQILSFSNGAGTTSQSYAACLFVKGNGTSSTESLGGTGFQLGYNRGDSTSQVDWSSTVLTYGTTYLIVMSYDLDNQTGSLWVDPTVSNVEPTPTVTSVTASTTAASTLTSFYVRMDSNAKTPLVTIDDLRVAYTWWEVLGQTSAPALSVAQNQISGLSVYPNPVKDGVVYISTSSSEDLSVEVYDLLGKKLISSEVTSGTLNVSSLLKGIYVMKITEGAATSTKKLVIE